jgi:hypothetical protein
MSSEDLENNKSDENNEISINNKEIKENHLSYKKDLWMYFESINSKFIKDRQKAKSLMYIISQKSILTEEYSNNLDLLYNQFFIELNYFLDEETINNNDDQKYILDNFLSTYLENIKNESILLKNYSKVIKNKILSNLEQNMKVQYEMNAHLNELYNTYENLFKTVIQNLNKYKENYEKTGKLVEKSKKDYEIMKEEIDNQKEKNEANVLKYKKCKEENNQRIKEAKDKQKKYEDYIVIANEERKKYIELSEKVYDLAQQLDNEYINLIKNNMTSLLNKQNELFNIIVQENENLLKNIDKINFDLELEHFVKSKFPKFSKPKPFIYEQYTPYLFLRERNKRDNSNVKNSDIYKNIVHDLNHLFISDKYKLNNNEINIKINSEENKEANKIGNMNINKINIDDLDYIRNIVHEMWNSKKIEFKKVNNLLKNEELRILILREINQYRNEGIFLLDKISYDNLAKLFDIIINNSKKVKDYESIKTCMILSTTFYKKLDDKILLQKEIMKNEIWKNPNFWEEIIDYSIKEEINNSKGYLIFLEETEEKRKERVKYSANSVTTTFLYNMTLFQVPKKEKKNIIDLFLKKYEIEDIFVFHDDFEVNDMENEIIIESIASNLDVEPVEQGNQNAK